MHPIEHLRYVARSHGLPAATLVREAAYALASVADSVPELVMACRQIIGHHPESGPLVHLSARLLCSPDPRAEAWAFADGIDHTPGHSSDDPTDHTVGGHLIDALPSPTTVFFDGDSPFVDEAFEERPDLRASWVVDEADIAIVTCGAADPNRLLIDHQSLELLADADYVKVPVWAVVDPMAVLPAPLFDRLLARAGAADRVVGREAFARVIDESGSRAGSAEPLPTSCPLAYELA